ncbi:O-antigen ligase family protein [Tissierellaceae bacterium BX21]|uniref:O-antigen ligase family protein n=2 Tax=Paratissierella segnis TaxID=2763679 RepID=A0A926EV86_9FIRM|nr:O-antigen ligase family protein [Paratissierella segnis]
MVEHFKQMINNSKFISYLKGPDIFQNLWVNSFVFRILNTIVNLPIKFLRKIYYKWNNIFSSSFFLRILDYLCENFHHILGLFLIINMIIPDHRWYNKYGVILTLLIFIMFLFKATIKKDINIDLSQIDYMAVIFFLTIFISAISSLFPKDSLNYLIYYFITFLSVIIIVCSINSYEELDALVKFMMLGVFLTAIYGIYQWKVVGIEVNPSLTDLTINQGVGGRVYSTMGNPNVYGELLVLTLPFFGSIILNENSFFKKIFWIILSLPILLVLLKTSSRSAWIAFAIAVFIFIFLWNKKYTPYLILLGVVALPFLPSSIYKRILTVFNPNDTSLKYRKQILGPAFAMLRDYWLTGVGLGSRIVNIIYQRYKSFGLTTVAHTHNLYVQLWLEAGICAIVSFMLTIFRLIRNTFVAIKEKNNPSINNILIASLSGILGLCVMGFADHIWFYNRLLFMFWINISIILASLKLSKMENK